MSKTERGDLSAVTIPIHRLGSNSLILFLSYGLNTFLAGVVAIFLVRYLGRQEYGLLSATFAYVSFFTILTSIGVDTIVTRNVARDPRCAGELVGGAIGLRLLLSLLSMALCWLLLPMIRPSARLAFLVILASASFPFSFYSLYLVLYSVELQMGRPKLVFGVWSILLAGGKLAMIALRFPLEAFVAAELVSGAAVFFVARELGRRTGLRPLLRLDRSLAAALLRESWPVALASTSMQFYLRIDQVMLYRMVGAEQVGLYAVGVRLVEFANLVPIVFMGSVFPLFSRLSGSGEARMEEATRLSFRVMAWGAFPLAAFLFIYAPPVLRLLFGESFVESAPMLRLLAWSLVFGFANSVLYNRLFATGGQRTAACLAIGAALLNVALNIPLIERFGGTGAAVATLISYGSVPLFALALSSSRPVGRMALETLLRPAVAAAAALAAVTFLEASLIAGIALMSGVYLMLIVMTGEVGRRELRILATAMGRGQ